MKHRALLVAVYMKLCDLTRSRLSVASSLGALFCFFLSLCRRAAGRILGSWYSRRRAAGSLEHRGSSMSPDAKKAKAPLYVTGGADNDEACPRNAFQWTFDEGSRLANESAPTSGFSDIC